MGKNDVVNAEVLSAGQKKRLDRKKEIAAAKKKKRVQKIVAIVVCAALLIGCGYGIGYSIYKSASITKPISDFSLGITDDGKLEGITVKDIVKTIDFNNISIKYTDIELKEADLQKKIDEVLTANKFFSEDKELTAKAGDYVNINYSCVSDGETVSNVGNAGVKDGLNFTISSTIGATATPTPTATPSATPTPTAKPSTYQALFQEGMIGMHPGETKDIEVTIPVDFKVGSTASLLAGKTVVFKVTLNKIQVTPELTDAFVTEKLKEESNCTSAEEYKAYLKETTERETLESKIVALIEDTDKNTSVSEYPSKYLKTKKGQVMYSYQAYLSQWNSLYGQYGYGYRDIYEMNGVKWKEMEAIIDKSAKKIVAVDCAYQYIFEQLGLTIEAKEYQDFVLEDGTYKTVEEFEAKNSKGYAMKSLLQKKVIETLADKAKVEK